MADALRAVTINGAYQYFEEDQLAVGEVSNMYDILGRMQEAAKVITL